MKRLFTTMGQLAAILLLVLSCSNQARSQVTTQGDLMFTAVGSRGALGTDSFSFVLLKAVSAGNTISFTDRGWNGSSWNVAGANESKITWTVGAGGLPIGTEVLIVGTNAYVYGSGTPNGSISGTAFDLRPADQVIAYIGDIDAPPYTVIAGIHWNSCSAAATDATWDVPFNGSTGCTVTANTSSVMPPQSNSGATPTLSNSVSAFYLGRTGGVQNVAGKFDCSPTSGAPFATVAAARAAILNSANWSLTTSGGVSTGLTGCTYIGVNAPGFTTQPVNDTACSGGTAQFSLVASGVGPFTYQWQVSTTGIGGSYSNISAGPYSGTTSATLNVTSTTGLNNYAYRCNVTNSGGTSTSNEALLRVDVGVPTISIQPNDAAICPNGGTILSASATNGVRIVYKWQVSTDGGSNYSNISDVGVYSGSATTSLTISGAPVSMYGYRYRLTATNECGTTNSNGAILTFSSTWSGGTNGNWNVSGNWSCGIPDQNTDAVIPITGNSPTVNVAAAVRNLTINTGATLTIGNNNSLAIYGNVSNSGTFNANGTGATTSYNSTAAQTLPSATYTNLTLSGGGNKNLGGAMTVNGTLALSGNTRLFLGANTMTLDAASSITGYNSTNYIVTNGTGFVKKNTISTASGTVDFPIGTNSAYTPIQLSNTGTSDNFSARVIDGVYVNYIGNTPVGAPITNRVVNKTWYVAEDVAGNSNATLTVQWNATDELGTFNRSSVTLSHYTSSKWQGNVLGPVSGTNPYRISRSNITSFSPFGVGNGGTPLPVTIQTFNAAYNNKQVDLYWAVGEESNTLAYEVERSQDAEHFVTIGKVPAARKASYSYADQNVTAGNTYYYRLKMVDFGSEFAYSRVVKVITGTDSKNSITLVKNPVQQSIELNINSSKDDVAAVTIYDISGRKVSAGSYPVRSGRQVVTVPSTMMVPGNIYLVRVSMENMTSELKVTRQ